MIQHGSKNRPTSKFVEYVVTSTSSDACSTSGIYYSPCAEASKASLACMETNDYDREKCMAYFQAYRDCKKAWVRCFFDFHFVVMLIRA